MKIQAKNKKGGVANFEITATKTTGNYFDLIVKSNDIEIETIEDGHSKIVFDGLKMKEANGFSFKGFNMPKYTHSQLLINNINGKKNDRFTLNFSNSIFNK